jgi:hypothetical protein
MRLTDEQIAQKLRSNVGNIGVRNPSSYDVRVTCEDLIEAADAIERLMRDRDGWKQWVEDVQDVRENANAEGYAEAKAHYEALLDVDRLTDIITDSIDLDWTPRTAAKAIVRAMKGGDT